MLPSANDKCKRKGVHGLDHYSTRCYLYGFDSGYTKAHYYGIDTSTQYGDSVLDSVAQVFRRGTKMPFVNNMGLSLVHTMTLPSNIPSMITLTIGCLYAQDVTRLIEVPIAGLGLGAENTSRYTGQVYRPYCP